MIFGGNPPEIDQDSSFPAGLSKTVNDGRLTGIYVGTITNTKDYDLSGELTVAMPVLGAVLNDDIEPDPETNLKPGEILVKPTTPFGGTTNALKDISADVSANDYKFAPQTYGLFTNVPDEGNRVLVCFNSGNVDDPYILSYIPGPKGKNFMGPGNTASTLNYDGIGVPLPTTEKSLIDPIQQEGTDHPRPVYRDAAEPIVKQGLVGDSVRGPTPHGVKAVRSQVMGILTPGAESPNKEDPRSFRLPGHSFVLDDNLDSSGIRLRTGGGAQILMNDPEGIVYVINGPGTGWVEISKDGSINVFGEGSINMRAKGSFNLRADKDVNIEAGKNLKLKAAGDMLKGENVGMPPTYDTKIHTGAIGSGGSVHIESVSGTTIQAGTNAVLDAQNGDLNLKAANRFAVDGRKIDIISTIKNPPVGDTEVIGGINISAAGGPVGILGTTGLNLVGTAGIGLAGVPILLNSPPGAAGLLPQIGLPGKGATRLPTIDHVDLSTDPPEFNIDADSDSALMPNQGTREEIASIESIADVVLTAEPYAGHYKSDALADASTDLMEEDFTADESGDDETTATNDPYAGYKAEIKKVLTEVTKKRQEQDESFLKKGITALNIPGIDLSSILPDISNFDLGPLKGEINSLMNYEGTLQGLLNVEFPFNIPTVNSLMGDYVIGFGINLNQFQFDIKQLQVDLNGIMAEAQNLQQLANNPMGAISSLANNTIGDVTKSLGVDNIKDVGDVSNLTNSIMSNSGLTSNDLNTMVNDITNQANLGDGDG
tara:strand:- start:7767 stop:10073 length:2307 start_codon:yes stop_codon:yes gene_type:complete